MLLDTTTPRTKAEFYAELITLPNDRLAAIRTEYHANRLHDIKISRAGWAPNDNERAWRRNEIRVIAALESVCTVRRIRLVQTDGNYRWVSA